MGLEEKRAVKGFQDSKLPGLMKEIQALINCPVEIDWDSLASGDGADPVYWADAWERVFFRPVIEGLREISRDDLGRDALKNGLKKVVMCNKGGNWGDAAFSFENGVLKIDHKPFTNIDDVRERTKLVTDVISKAL
jgi:hypothetical protein